MPVLGHMFILGTVLATAGCGQAGPQLGSERKEPGEIAPPVSELAKSTQTRKTTSPPQPEPAPSANESAVTDEPAAETPSNSKHDGENTPLLPLPSETDLAAIGIDAYHQGQVDLYTDIDADEAQRLVDLADRFLRSAARANPERKKPDERYRAFVMSDGATFRETGLWPLNLPPFEAGRQRGYEVWLHDQTQSYYRGHLLLHELAHAVVIHAAGIEKRAPWFEEGLAEYWAAHRRTATGDVEFGVMPNSNSDFRGWGRIELLQQEVKEGRLPTLDQLTNATDADFTRPLAYAWCWALFSFSAKHPAMSEAHQQLLQTTGPAEFEAIWETSPLKTQDAVKRDWLLFCHNVDYGYDIQRAASVNRLTNEPIATLTPNEKLTIEVAANRGWHCSGIICQTGDRLRISATGLAVVQDKPQRWESTPDGLAIRHVQGSRIGRLLVGIMTSTEAFTINDQTTNPLRWQGGVPLNADWTTPEAGELVFRVNDRWSSLDDNSSGYRIIIEPGAEQPQER